MNSIDQNVINLSKRDQDRLFRLLRDNADILTKVIPNLPLLEYIRSGVTNNSDNLIIQAYNVWKITRD
jgi:hypothetical protein